jgi:hypothetical protein
MTTRLIHLMVDMLADPMVNMTEVGLFLLWWYA